MSPDRRATGERFFGDYTAALRGYASAPSEDGLQTAYELGRRSLADGISLLELVAKHQELVQSLGPSIPVEAEVTNSFLREVLAAFEITQRGYAEAQRTAQAEQSRVELLHDLTHAYLAVVEVRGLEGRLGEAAAQAKRLLGAESAVAERLQGDRASSKGEVGRTELGAMSTRLPGGIATFTVRRDRGAMWSDADRAALEQLAVLVAAPVLDASLLEFSARLDRIRPELGAQPDPGPLTQALLGCSFDWTGAIEGGVVLAHGRGLEVVAATPASEHWLGVATDAAEHPVREVVRSSSPVVLDAKDLGLAGGQCAVVPVQTAGGQAGAFAVVLPTDEPLDEARLSFLAQVGDRLANALEDGRTRAHELAARLEAEMLASRLRHLQQLAADLARAATRRRVADVLLRRLLESSGATSGVVAAFEPRSKRLDLLAGRLPSGVEPAWAANRLDAIVEAVARDGAERVIDRTRSASAGSDLDGLGPVDAVPAVAIFPMTFRQHQVGFAVLGWSAPPAIGASTLDLIRAQALMAGAALLRATRFDLEHEIADTLQRSLLTMPAFERPGLRWTAHYRPGTAGLAGGDWYDIIELDEHRVGLAIGDIVGRGVQAAATMGQLRSATRALASVIKDPGELLTAVDHFVTTTGQGQYSTMAYAILDTSSGELSYASAGHVPPLLRLPDGEVVRIDGGRGPLLGITTDRPSDLQLVPPGSQLVLYTDGLIERRDEPLDRGIDRLATLLAGTNGLDLDEARAVLVRELEVGQEDADDLAVLLVAYLGEAPSPV